MSGMVSLRRPPNMKAEIGTPCGCSHCGSIDGHWLAATVKRAFGCAALVALRGVHGLPSQSVSSAGAWSVMPSHHTSPSGVVATLVKMQLRDTVAMALALDCVEVPGATPKNPYSGLMAYRRPSA